MTKKRLLPTSTVGSLPKPAWLAPPEKLWSPWKLEGDGLIEGKQDALLISLQEQQLAGLDIICDGEQTRQHFVTTFIEHLSGVDFENRKIVKIRYNQKMILLCMYFFLSRIRLLKLFGIR